jgi:hypothetical protein
LRKYKLLDPNKEREKKEMKGYDSWKVVQRFLITKREK